MNSHEPRFTTNNECRGGSISALTDQGKYGNGADMESVPYGFPIKIWDNL